MYESCPRCMVILATFTRDMPTLSIAPDGDI